MEALPKLCRVLIFDAAYGASEIATLIGRDDFLSQRGLDIRVVEGLQDIRGEIRTEIVAGNAKGALKAAVPALVSPVVDDEVERFRAEWLDEGDRLELIDAIGETATTEIRADAEEFRKELSRGRKFIRLWGIGLLVGGALLLLLVHLTNLGRGLRRVGVSLVIAGLVYFGIAKLLQSIIGQGSAGLLNEITSGQPDIPESLTRLIGDILVSLARNLAQGMDDLALPVLIAGAAVFAASFFIPIGRRLVSRSGG